MKFSKDYYLILGVDPSASQADIRHAYLILARQWHPDMHVGESQYKIAFAEEWFKHINEAYEVLSDSSKKAHYDAAYASRHCPHPKSNAQKQTKRQANPKKTWSCSRSKTNAYIHAWQAREYAWSQRHSQETTEARKRNGNENRIIMTVVAICVVLYGLICGLSG